MKIKRPLFIIALSVLVVIYAINSMPGSTFMYSLALFALYTVFHFFTKNKYTLSLVLSLIAAVLGLLYFKDYNNVLDNKINILTDMGNTTVIGIITDKTNVSATNYYTVDIINVSDIEIADFKVNVYSDDLLEKGMKIELTGKYKAFTPNSNYIYNYSKGIFGYFYADKINVVKEKEGINGLFIGIKQKLIDNSRKIFDYKAVPLAVAMGLGDKSLMDNTDVKSFNFIGLSHTLVVSGLHVGFITAVLKFLLSMLPVYKKIQNIVLMICIFMFMGIIGFTPSIIRAGFLLIIMLAGRNLILETDNYTILAVIILITLFANPYSANNVSLLLSYGAYFGVVFRRDIAKNKGWGKIVTTLMLSTFAVIFTAPVMALTGMDTTLLAPLFNLLFSPSILAICTLSFLLPVVYLIPILGPAICFVVAPVNEVLIKLLISAADYGRNYLGFAVVELGTDKAKFIVMFTAVVVVFVILQFENTRLRNLFLLAIPVMAILCYNYKNRDIVFLKAFDGSSNPSYIISCEDKDYLIATENINSTTFKRRLEKHDIDRFEEIIICSKSAADTDFYEKYTDSIYLPDKNSSYTTNLFSIDTCYKNRAWGYILNISGVKIGFTHNKFDLSEEKTDFYFLGAEAPRAFNTKSSYYFYPAIKENIDLIEQNSSVELYDTLTIKINRKTGGYTIVKDVKNFGGQL